VHAAGVADPFLLISCKSLQKEQRFEKTSLTWENGHAVHAVGVADPFLKKPHCVGEHLQSNVGVRCLKQRVVSSNILNTAP
jgi:hypothetical protein